MSKKLYELNLAGRPFSIETGELAKQAHGAALVRYGDTVVLVAVTASKGPKDLDFFPLTVNYEERLYAVGKIPGGFIKREGRPSDKAILASRLIDRPIRPLFAEGFRNDVSISATVMSADADCSSEMAAMIGTSVALSISDIPFMGPIAGVVVGRVDNQFVINPTVDQLEKSDINLTVAGTKEAINMVEASAKEVPEEVMLEAILFGHEKIKEIISFQETIINEVGKEKREIILHTIDPEIDQAVRAYAKDDIAQALQIEEKQEKQNAIDKIILEVVEHFSDTYPDQLKLVNEVLHQIVKDGVRNRIIFEAKRPDGRGLDEIRPITCDINRLPRTHGSGLFTRGQTQALSICTLGPLGDVQILDGLDLAESKRFMHHYNFPAFSVGESRPMRGPGRREIGHGALGEKALEPVIPSEEQFPYAIRVVSEVLESNGSTSQASICASTLALMHAGVPIKTPVAGIAMGLVKSDDQVAVLTDIQGMEDHLGDMDFKVAGTREGVTALQMDIKISGINKEILEKALSQAKAGRLHILDKMLEAISEPNKELSEFAPKITTLKINSEKIRDVIGPGGRVINKIIEDTGVKIDIEQDGRIFIASLDIKNNIKAKETIENLIREAEVGKTYLGTVKRIEKFGAFVEVIPGKEGLCHISQLDVKRVEKVEDVVKLGDTILVKVTEIDNQGRINISRKEVLKEQEVKERS